ncbi:xaa-Pro aminopeptidase 3 [Trichoplusia ni]|uniref:Xaa-Pro aminopeptidase 3 n=1 Tax=Trichoplusia ni TaxID=7111 RepID=A0A7E5VKQ5_TRINI|nr:xaa-Pro aminopeptidase 3 [Trichoplusia ni]
MSNLFRLALNIASKDKLQYRLIQVMPRCLSTVETPPKEKHISLSIPKGIMGQPTCHTHPHLVQPDCLTWGMTQLEYKDRRDRLVSKLVGEAVNMHNTHIIVIPAARKQYMSDQIPYVFRQNSDFYYLTGCMEPSAVLVLIKYSQSHDYRSLLFVHDHDAHTEMWEGPRTGVSNAAVLFGVDEALPVEKFGNVLNNLTSHKTSVIWYHNENPANPDIHNTVRATLNGNVSLADPKRAMHFMRVVKSAAEVELMKASCEIGAQSINLAMACTRPGTSEHLVNAILEYSCKQGGAEHLAFPPVVAGGPRATHIHYVANNQKLTENEMLLVDSGCQRWLYNSDMCRTWPVSGKFSRHHRILYELVLSVQKRLIELLAEHRPPLHQLFDDMCRLLGHHLQQEGILPKHLSGQELVGRAYRLCPHHVSHYLGLDVHDAPLVPRSVPISSNMVITVEPGIYIRPDDTSIPKEFRGIGIRIEDDVLITDGDPVILTDSCVKEVADIEALVGTQSL